MREQFADVLNQLFTETYYNIGKYEETILKNAGKHNLSLNDFHLIECIGNGGDNGRTVGEIAQNMNVTLPTVTVALNKLEKKNYVTKNKIAEDGRVVYIKLTRQGQKMNTAHRYFHKNMIRIIGNKFTDDELEILIRCMKTLNNIFIIGSEQADEKEVTEGL